MNILEQTQVTKNKQTLVVSTLVVCMVVYSGDCSCRTKWSWWLA